MSDQVKQCPLCSSEQAADALFCESCGYDFVTGATPAGQKRQPVEASMREPEQIGAPEPEQHAPSNAPDLPAAAAVPPTSEGQLEPASWVAEVWIDPEWYRIQQSSEQLPSPGQPVIVGLRGQSLLVGRRAPDNAPDIVCGNDSGISRRHALLTHDGRRWFIEDLGSSNGTYIGQVDQPLPTEPISGRVELDAHDRVYLGIWTRLVVRPALVQEARL